MGSIEIQVCGTFLVNKRRKVKLNAVFRPARDENLGISRKSHDGVGEDFGGLADVPFNFV
jgi:hypothetical protein